MAYSAYGELLTEKVSGFCYNGEYYDAATGMLNLRARQYEPAQARFSQRDSEKGNAANARSLNAYLYCQNDAINFFDASGAALSSIRNVVYAEGGGTAKKVASTVQSKANPATLSTAATVAKAVSAAAAAKTAVENALTKGLVSSILKENKKPETALQQVRAKRAAISMVGSSAPMCRTKLGACMSQEEYDDSWIIYGVDMPSDTSNSTPQIKIQSGVIMITFPEPSTTPTTAAATLPPGYASPTPTPDITTQYIQEFAEFVRRETEDNHSFYVWGGKGQSVYDFKTEKKAEDYIIKQTDKWKKAAEKGGNRIVPDDEYWGNVNGVLAHYRDAIENGYDAHMYDCSGVFSAFAASKGYTPKGKLSVEDLKNLSDPITIEKIQEGDWIFRGRHVAYVIEVADSGEFMIGQAEGHKQGMTIRPYSETGKWEEARRPKYEEIFGGGN